MTTTMLMVILIACVAILVANYIGYKNGIERGGKDEFERGFKATKKTIDTLIESQKHAGITDDQIEKMNKFVMKEIKKSK